MEGLYIEMSSERHLKSVLKPLDSLIRVDNTFNQITALKWGGVFSDEDERQNNLEE